MPPRGAIDRIRDILDAIVRIQGYAEGLTYERFCADVRTAEAVQFNFIVIGEAASRVPAEIVARNPEIPWQEMRSLRNFVAHGYFAVSFSVLWETMTSDLPSVIEPLRELVRACEAEGEN